MAFARCGPTLEPLGWPARQPEAAAVDASDGRDRIGPLTGKLRRRGGRSSAAAYRWPSHWASRILLTIAAG